MSILLEFLVKNNYKPPEKFDFKSKLKEYFGISDVSKESETEYLSHPNGYEIDVKNQFLNTYEVEIYFLQEIGI